MRSKSYNKLVKLPFKYKTERLYLSNNTYDIIIVTDYNIRPIKKNKGRIFFLGVGGSAGNCSHAVNDFRKIINVIVMMTSGLVATLGYDYIPYKAYVIVAAFVGLLTAYILNKIKKNYE